MPATTFIVNQSVNKARKKPVRSLLIDLLLYNQVVLDTVISKDDSLVLNTLENNLFAKESKSHKTAIS